MVFDKNQKKTEMAPRNTWSVLLRKKKRRLWSHVSTHWTVTNQ